MAKVDISKEEVLHLADLARLELTHEEVARYQKDLGAILGYLEKLKGLPMSAEAVAVGEEVALRPDNVSEFSEAKALIEAAPQHEGGYVKVPAVFDREHKGVAPK